MKMHRLLALAPVAIVTSFVGPLDLHGQSPNDSEIAAMVKAAEVILARWEARSDDLGELDVLLSRGESVAPPTRPPRPGESFDMPGTYKREHSLGVLNAVARALGVRVQLPNEGRRCTPRKECVIVGGNFILQVGAVRAVDDETRVAVDVEYASSMSRTGVDSASYDVTLSEGPDGWSVVRIRLTAVT